MGSRGSKQAGIVLEQLLSEELMGLGVPNTLTRGNGYNIEERVDLRVPAIPFSGQPEFEFQLTLKKGVQRKMREFVLAALKNQDRGVRIYLEIASSRFRNLRDIARRAAYAIKEIVHRWKQFERYDLQGVRVRAGRSKNGRIEKFSLLDRVGEWALEAFSRHMAHLEALALEEQKRQQAEAMRQQALRKRLRNRPPSPPFFPAPAHDLRLHTRRLARKYFGVRTTPARMFMPLRQP